MCGDLRENGACPSAIGFACPDKFYKRAYIYIGNHNKGEAVE